MILSRDGSAPMQRRSPVRAKASRLGCFFFFEIFPEFCSSPVVAARGNDSLA